MTTRLAGRTSHSQLHRYRGRSLSLAPARYEMYGTRSSGSAYGPRPNVLGAAARSNGCSPESRANSPGRAEPMRSRLEAAAAVGRHARPVEQRRHRPQRRQHPRPAPGRGSASVNQTANRVPRPRQAVHSEDRGLIWQQLGGHRQQIPRLEVDFVGVAARGVLSKRATMSVGTTGGQRWVFSTTAPVARALEALERLGFPARHQERSARDT
jgi:hypothetical protein